jgi:hypothetical protein
MSPGRRIALIAGALYIATFVTSIPAVGLYEPVTDHVDYALGDGADDRVLFAGLLELLLAITGIGTAVVLYPVTRRLSPTLGLGFVTSRVVESALILVGVVSLLAVVTLRQDSADADARSLVVVSQALVAVHDWSFLFGPGVMPAISALCLGTVLYRSGLVPPVLPLLGLIGAPLLFGRSVAVRRHGGMGRPRPGGPPLASRCLRPRRTPAPGWGAGRRRRGRREPQPCAPPPPGRAPARRRPRVPWPVAASQ